MRTLLLAVQFALSDLTNDDYAQLYSKTRRDSLFAAVFQDEMGIVALRDHIGSMPLFYRRVGNEWRFSQFFSDLVQPDDALKESGVRHLIGFGTAKTISPIDAIGVVPPGCVMRFTDSVEIIYRYVLRPQQIPLRTPFADIVAHTETLFKQALARSIQHDTIGLYLSGGIDSALVGIYLRQMGVAVRAYTSAPWGAASSELAFAQVNVATIGVTAHYIDLLDSAAYENALAHMPSLYRTVHATSTAIGVASLWLNTPLPQEQQVFFGQNSDTMTCSVPAQYLAHQLRGLPAPLRRRWRMLYADVIASYLGFVSQGLAHAVPPTLVWHSTLNAMQRLIVAGMTIAHSPSDGEVLSQPGIAHNIRMSNPYYDVDLIEWCLGIPLHQAVVFHASRSRPLTYEKRVFQAIAGKYLPPDLVRRKKAFTVSLDRDAQARSIAATFPTHVLGIPIPNREMQTRAEMLRRWCQALSVNDPTT